MFATIGHTFELMKMSWNVLMKDRELILFPVMSGLGLLILGFAGLAAGVADTGTAEGGEAGSANLVAFLAMILIAYFITTFFNAALISAALERLRGGDPNVMSGLAHASKHIHHIFLWSVISAIVGTLFRVLRSQTDNFLVQMIYSMIEGVWEFMTFFVIPVMVSENQGPISSIKRSAGIIRRNLGTPNHRNIRVLHRLPAGNSRRGNSSDIAFPDRTGGWNHRGHPPRRICPRGCADTRRHIQSRSLRLRSRRTARRLRPANPPDRLPARLRTGMMPQPDHQRSQKAGDSGFSLEPRSA